MARELSVDPARLVTRLIRRTRHRHHRRLAECRKQFSTEAVHALRIETRRALALLDLVASLGLGHGQGKCRKTLKQQLDAFDALRDTQVALSLVAPRVRDFPEATPLEKYLERREKKLIAGLRRSIRAFKSRRVERFLKSLERDAESVQTHKRERMGDALNQLLGETFASVVELRRKVRRSDMATIHRLRIAFKRFRYLCEFLQPMLAGVTPRRLRELQTWQKRMGDIQDLKVLLGGMKRAARRNDVPAAALKNLQAALARRLEILVNRFVSQAGRLEKFRPALMAKKTARL